MNAKRRFLSELLSLTSVLSACVALPQPQSAAATLAVGSDAASAIVQASVAEGISATEAIPGLAAIRVSYMLDPLLTRSMYMGDRWVNRDTFEHVVQPGSRGSLDVRVAGLDKHGRELNIALTADWTPIDSDGISVSPTRGNRTTITMKSPGEGVVRVTCGELTETLRLQAHYDRDKDATQLVIVRQRGARTVPNDATG